MITQQLDIRESLKNFLPEYPSSSRVWIYQSSRAFGEEEAQRIEGDARKFTSEWAAHNVALDATARVVYNRFLILIVNPGIQDASGCSIDNSVHFVQELEKTYNTHFFDRTNMAVHHDGNIVNMSLNSLKQSVKEASLPEDAYVFDNTIITLGDLRSKWLLPVYQSCLTK